MVGSGSSRTTATARSSTSRSPSPSAAPHGSMRLRPASALSPERLAVVRPGDQPLPGREPQDAPFAPGIRVEDPPPRWLAFDQRERKSEGCDPERRPDVADRGADGNDQHEQDHERAGYAGEDQHGLSLMKPEVGLEPTTC